MRYEVYKDKQEFFCKYRQHFRGVLLISIFFPSLHMQLNIPLLTTVKQQKLKLKKRFARMRSWQKWIDRYPMIIIN
ncbi:hypothetical protein A6M23_15400 [Acidithiobacillus thiooxidans]|uniref:Uncharacterized protein n=1 Tax=Acidithiobacillus thiooxidans TaxID=930 RepID=A0A1C2JCY0_ACITH|nr:hypothetical protein A6M23_15400 [Acidithiobacillus thiooxidans]OCX86091.1 hypothetical protein A6P08_06760 [Acidithiobacillus thiooxidans]